MIRAEPNDAPTARATRRHSVAYSLELLAVVLLAFVVRLAALHHPHFYDELYHLLAATSLVERGTPTIAAGEPYTRARGYTYLIAAVFKLAGIGMTQLRSVSLVAGTITVGLLFGWLRRAVGHPTAWIATLLLALDPEAVAYSTAGRFYAVQSLFFLAAVVAVWWATLPDRAMSSRLAALAGAAVALVAAIHLQVATVLGAVLLAVWAAFAMLPFAGVDWRRRRTWIAAAGLALVAIVVVAWLTGLVSWALRMTMFVPAWAVFESHEVRFYYWGMLLDYPLLVALLPVLAVLALGRWPREATLCLLVAGGVLAYHSLAAFKATRFVLYVKPLWLTASAMGIAVLVPYIWQRTMEVLDRWAPGTSPRARRRVGRVALAAMFVFALFANPALMRMRHLMRSAGTDPWVLASGQLRQLAARSDVVLGAARLPMVNFVGRIDVVLERPDAVDADRELDGWDSQVGRPVIATVPAFQTLMSRYPRGLVVSDTTHWRKRWAVRDSLADYIEHTLERVPLRDPNFIVYRWSPRPTALVGAR